MQKASRSDWRNNAKQFRSTYKVPVEKIEVEEGWNIRQLFDGINELADDIENNGLHEPLVVELNRETGMFKIRDGERRFKAIMVLIQRGVEFPEVEVKPLVCENQTDGLFFMLGTGVNKSEYQPIEIANGILRIKELDPEITNLKIGLRLGRSRQWVDNMVKLAKKSDDVKEKVAAGEMNYTDAIKSETAPTQQIIDAVREADGEIDDIYFSSNGFVVTGSVPVIAPAKDPSLIDEMAGIIPADKQQRPSDTETDKLARQMAKEERQEEQQEKLKDPDLEAIRKSVLANCAKLEGLAKGLPTESEAEHDRILGYIRKSMQLDIFEAVKGKLKR